jgi:hypothetical protein
MGWCFIKYKITFDRWMKMDWNWLCGRRVHNIFLYFLKERSWVSLCGLIKSWHTNWKWLTNNKPWRKQWRSMQNCCWGFTVFPGDKFLWKSDTQSRDGKWKRTNNRTNERTNERMNESSSFSSSKHFVRMTFGKINLIT